MSDEKHRNDFEKAILEVLRKHEYKVDEESYRKIEIIIHETGKPEVIVNYF